MPTVPVVSIFSISPVSVVRVASLVPAIRGSVVPVVTVPHVVEIWPIDHVDPVVAISSTKVHRSTVRHTVMRVIDIGVMPWVSLINHGNPVGMSFTKMNSRFFLAIQDNLASLSVRADARVRVGSRDDGHGTAVSMPIANNDHLVVVVSTSMVDINHILLVENSHVVVSSALDHSGGSMSTSFNDSSTMSTGIYDGSPVPTTFDNGGISVVLFRVEMFMDDHIVSVSVVSTFVNDDDVIPVSPLFDNVDVVPVSVDVRVDISHIVVTMVTSVVAVMPVSVSINHNNVISMVSLVEIDSVPVVVSVLVIVAVRMTVVVVIIVVSAPTMSSSVAIIVVHIIVSSFPVKVLVDLYIVPVVSMRIFHHNHIMFIVSSRLDRRDSLNVDQRTVMAVRSTGQIEIDQVVVVLYLVDGRLFVSPRTSSSKSTTPHLFSIPLVGYIEGLLRQRVLSLVLQLECGLCAHR